MKDLLCDQFQETVDETLIRHRSILDIMSKLQEANARVIRALTKAVTSCGCVRIDAKRPNIPEGISLHQLRDHMETHLVGQVCDHCQEVLETELGHNLFYVAAICNATGLNLYDIMLKEQKRLSALGVYNFG